MSALSIQVPFPVFQGRDGQPLENGYIWIGEPNLNPQTNPVVAYYDAAMTIVAPQPLRTLNGYVSRAGTPAQIYVAAFNFSILVQDSKGSMVYNFSEGAGISPAASGANSDITSLSGLTTPLSVAQGGTGATTAAAAPFALKGANSDITSLTALTSITLTSINGGQLAGLRNRIINGAMLVSQRATFATVTAGTAVPTASTGYPCVDRFFVYSTGANVTAARVAGADATSQRLQITGAASVTAVGVGQRIESFNSYDMAGSTCTLSVDLANSLLTTVTWSAYYANTANTFGTIGNPTKTLISTGTFTVFATVTRYNAQIAVPAAAVTGVEIVLTVGAQTSGTFTVGKMQLEVGSTATTFEQRPYGMELALCQRYLPIASSGDVALGVTTGTTGGIVLYRFGVEPRVPPTGVSTSGGANLTTGTVASALTLVTFTSSGSTMARLAATGTGSPYTANQPLILVDSGSLKIIFIGCEL